MNILPSLRKLSANNRLNPVYASLLLFKMTVSPLSQSIKKAVMAHISALFCASAKRHLRDKYLLIYSIFVHFYLDTESHRAYIENKRSATFAHTFALHFIYTGPDSLTLLSLRGYRTTSNEV